MTYPEAIDFLFTLHWFGARFGLKNTFKLAALAGNPQDRLRFIHVAGTNGKGSTCAMLESIYRAAGLRVGLFTSPHLVAFGERLQVNRRPIPDAEVVRLASELREWLRGFPADDHPTFFEAATAMALRYFAEQKCDLVVWETGLGGRLDATNIVTPLLSVITNVQYDHQDYLGDTLASIAAEKAGIIKPGVPVVTGSDAPEAWAVIEQTALRQGAPLTTVPASAAHQPALEGVSLPLMGEHQRMNAAVALAAVRVLQPLLPVSDQTVRAGLSRIDWPGRLQLATLAGDRRILLDGAHNLAGAQSLAAALRDSFPGTKPVLVLGILRDKDWAAMCQTLAPLAERILLVPVHSERTAGTRSLAEACRRANPGCPVLELPSLSAALAEAAGAGFVTIAGSLYLVGEALELLRLSAAPAGERDLNEWTAGDRARRPAG